VLASILHLSQRLLPADAHAIWRCQASSGRWEITSAAGLSDQYQQAAIRILDETSIMPDAPIIADDVDALPMLAPRLELYRAEGIRSLLVMPLRTHGRVCGTLAFYFRQPHRFSDHEVQLATAVANMSAAAMSAADLFAEQARLENRFARFMQHLPGLAWIKDLEGRYVYANEAAARAFQREAHDLYGKTDDEIFSPQTAAQFKENDRQALASPSGVQVVESLEHSDGVVHHSLVSKFPIPDHAGLPALVGGMAIDITERRRAEQDAQFLADALKEADRRKDEFLALLGHELRNPLAPISNSLNILKLPGANASISRQAREMMERQVEHMVRLVDDLLDVSRIMRGKIELRREPLELAAVVARAVETSQPRLDAEGHRLTVMVAPESVRLYGDLVRLAQVVSNLLDNAAKYTERGGHIWLTAVREGNDAVVRVRDTGIGITPASLPRLFDMFYQAERRTRKSQGGLGIGLSLVRGLAELHGGTAQAHSDGLGAGSEFVVRLPLLDQPAAETPPPVAEQPAAPLPPRRVLVVDDNVDAADSLAMLLRLEGQQVMAAYDGPTALAQAEATPPAIAFIDLGMPKMDGFELARAFQSLPALRGVMLVALTGWGQPEDRQRTAEAGFHHHLVKPLDMQTLRRFLGTRW
jgi:PAS domain S-box-containing protein